MVELTLAWTTASRARGETRNTQTAVGTHRDTRVTQVAEVDALLCTLTAAQGKHVRRPMLRICLESSSSHRSRTEHHRTTSTCTRSFVSFLYCMDILLPCLDSERLLLFTGQKSSCRRVPGTNGQARVHFKRRWTKENWCTLLLDARTPISAQTKL